MVDGSTVLARVLSGGEDRSIAVREDLMSSVDELVDGLRHTVFLDDNVESIDGASVTYLLDTMVTCQYRLAEDGIEPDPTDMEECLTEERRVESRVVVTRVACDAGDNVNLMSRVDELEVGTVFAHQNLFATILPFPELFEAAARKNPPDPGESIVARSGELLVTLESTAAGASLLEVSVTEALDGEAESESGPLGLKVGTGKLVSLEAAKAEGTIAGQIAVPGVEVTLPLEEFVHGWFNGDSIVDPSEPGGGSVLADVAGFGTVVDFLAAEDRLTLSDLNLGSRTSTVKLTGGATLLSVDVNAETDRSFDVTFTSNDPSELALAFEPEFTLELGYSMKEVEDRASDLPSFTLDDDLVITASGAGVAMTWFEEQANEDLAITASQEGQLLRVDAGSLAMTSRAVPADDVEVAAGACLVGFDANQSSHEFLGFVATASCTP